MKTSTEVGRLQSTKFILKTSQLTSVVASSHSVAKNYYLQLIWYKISQLLLIPKTHESNCYHHFHLFFDGIVPSQIICLSFFSRILTSKQMVQISLFSFSRKRKNNFWWNDSITISMKKIITIGVLSNTFSRIWFGFIKRFIINIVCL